MPPSHDYTGTPALNSLSEVCIKFLMLGCTMIDEVGQPSPVLGRLGIRDRCGICGVGGGGLYTN